MTAELLFHLPGVQKLSEGPVWDHRTSLLWWVDIHDKKLYRYNPETGNHTPFSIDQYVGAAVLRSEKGLVLALERGFYLFDEETGSLSHLSDPEPDLPSNRFNDGKVDPGGTFWAGTMDNSEQAISGSLYSLEPQTLTFAKAFSGVSISNGLAWTADSNTFYYIDSPTQRVDGFDFDLASGILSKRREVLRFEQSFGTPDGMCIDTEDNLWIAFWEGSKVACFDPRTGKQLAQIDIPTQRITSCCFGGAEMDTLFITSAAKEGDSLGGAIFSAKPGVTGPPTNFFAG
ncbi:MAG: SMP-30/gluconolactonase/LRE family protein [Bacteroidota bacterium]